MSTTTAVTTATSKKSKFDLNSNGTKAIILGSVLSLVLLYQQCDTSKNTAEVSQPSVVERTASEASLPFPTETNRQYLKNLPHQYSKDVYFRVEHFTDYRWMLAQSGDVKIALYPFSKHSKKEWYLYGNQSNKLPKFENGSIVYICNPDSTIDNAEASFYYVSRSWKCPEQ